MAEELMRVRVYEDDREMQTIYQAYISVREESRSRRGRARRGAESEFLRRVLVAGYRQLYGEFPRPGAEQARPPGSTEADGHNRRKTKEPDIKTKVAEPEGDGNNDASPSQASALSDPAASKLDFSHLLAGGSSTR